MAGRVILRTKRLLLREFDEDDAEAIFRLGSDPLVTRFTHDRLSSIEEARAVLARPLADYRKHGYGRLACIVESGELIGFSGLKYLEDLGEVDVGYRFLPAYWGAGLATEAAQAVVPYGFEQLGLKRILGLVDPENVASVRVLEKTGLVFEEMIHYWNRPTARYGIHTKNKDEG